MDKKIEIERKRLIELLVIEEKFLRLERGSVEDWYFYEDVMFADNLQELDDFRKELEEKIC